MDNDPDVLGVGGHAHVEVRAEAVRACNSHRAAGEIIWLRRIEEGIHRPAGVVAVGAEVVNADIAGGDRRSGLRVGRGERAEEEDKQGQ